MPWATERKGVYFACGTGVEGGRRETERQANQEREHLQGNEGEGRMKERHRGW